MSRRARDGLESSWRAPSDGLLFVCLEHTGRGGGMSKLGALTRGGDVKAERDTSEGSSFLAERTMA